MEVKLLTHTPQPERVIAAAGKTCYSDRSPEDWFSYLTIDKVEHMLDVVHESCLEHVTFTFSIKSLSRTAQQQLTRHRLASYSVESMRYVDTEVFHDFAIPDSVRDILDSEGITDEDLEIGGEVPPIDITGGEVEGAVIGWEAAQRGLVRLLKERGVPPEDLRQFLPLGICTNLMVTMNYRELRHFCGLRRCTRAQWEIRELADRMAAEVEKECPVLYRHLPLDAQCGQLGCCPEHKSCGKEYTLSDYKMLSEIKLTVYDRSTAPKLDSEPLEIVKEVHNAHKEGMNE